MNCEDCANYEKCDMPKVRHENQCLAIVLGPLDKLQGLLDEDVFGFLLFLRPAAGGRMSGLAHSLLVGPVMRLGKCLKKLALRGFGVNGCPAGSGSYRSGQRFRAKNPEFTLELLQGAVVDPVVEEGRNGRPMAPGKIS